MAKKFKPVMRCITCDRGDTDQGAAPRLRDCGHYTHAGRCDIQHQHDEAKLARWNATNRPTETLKN